MGDQQVMRLQDAGESQYVCFLYALGTVERSCVGNSAISRDNGRVGGSGKAGAVGPEERWGPRNRTVAGLWGGK